MGMQLVSNKQYVVLKEGSVTSPKGFKAGGMHCGIKHQRLDLGYILSLTPAITAGVYTTNRFQAAPLLVTQESIKKEGKTQAILVNSGIANACTGEEGLQNAYAMRNRFANELGIKEHYVAVTSTGVIGVQLPMDKVEKGIQKILDPVHENVQKFEQSILTTDTIKKNIAVQVEIDGQTVTIGGAAKGSGMIHPNMATMLGFVTTDAFIDQDSLSMALKQITNQTFNMITVDGDTSTNDMVVVMANGQSNNKSLTPDHPDWEAFLKGLTYVCETLAKKIARDGEGATKLIEVKVRNSASIKDAQQVAKTVISSNLVKTAIYGADANWGRIVCAVGYSDVDILPNDLSVFLGPIKVVENGLPFPFSEEQAKKYLEQENIIIEVDLGMGQQEGTAWGCDLTYDYVKINASYRT
ncbi:bifunctional ornithine acetyltransferase/N-acetylglutamate synthase [Bacillaceae bacterium S4-13-56]